MTRARGLWLVCGTAAGLDVAAYVLHLRHLGPPASEDGIWATTATVLSYLAVAAVGALLAARVRGNPYAGVWCGLSLGLALGQFGTVLHTVDAVPAWVGQLVLGVGFLGTLGCFALVFLLFPTGRPPSPRWRWLAWATVGLVGVAWICTPLATIDGEVASPWPLPGRGARLLGLLVLAAVYGLFACCLAAMLATVVRWRAAGHSERKQLEWFAAAAVANGLLVLADLVGVDEEGALHAVPGLWTVLNGVAFLLLPSAVAIAVLRYRLYEIDRILSRTVTYGLVTGSLLAAYLVLVYVLRRLLEPLTGTNEVAVAGSTLTVAALFQPVRRRVQAAVDRRFDRARYDAARTVDAYARRLRTEVDLETVTEGLRDTVAATVGPQRVGLWLRAPHAPGGG
jgi:hypothetical protein